MLGDDEGTVHDAPLASGTTRRRHTGPPNPKIVKVEEAVSDDPMPYPPYGAIPETRPRSHPINRERGARVPEGSNVNAPLPDGLTEEERARQALGTDKRGPRGRKMKVRALKMGWMHEKRYRAGDVFQLDDANYQFSTKWMQRVPDDTPERITTGTEALKREHAALRRDKGGQLTDRDDASPLGD
ncbi:MAG TPA: hypothetical protein VK506_05790 [Conexibacter sp.]|nr:hypothetical protein [Conexibacter sp.]